MAKFPEPPSVDELRVLSPTLTSLAPGTTLFRIYFAGGSHPGRWDGFRRYGPTSSRWDPHLPGDDGRAVVQERGVMYAACGPEAVPTCLAEVFQRRRLIDARDGHPALVGFALAASLDLLDLTGRQPTRLGASTAMHSGPRPRARRWARAFYDAYPSIHGILYCSSMYGNAPAVALFERAAFAVPAEPDLHRGLSDPSLASALVIAADECGHELVLPDPAASRAGSPP